MLLARKNCLDDSFVLQAYLAQEPSFSSQSVLWGLPHYENNSNNGKVVLKHESVETHGSSLGWV